MKLILFAFCFYLCLTLFSRAQNNVPKFINYQGKLTNASGQPLSDGTYKLRFSLYTKMNSAQPGDSLVWGVDYNVTVIGGQFNAMLGAGGGTPVPGAAVNDIGFAFTGPERYVQLTVLTDNNGANLATPQVLLPRQQLMSVPYALNGTPAGAILPYAGTVAPPGYLMCDGKSFNKADYPALAAVLNTATGAAFGGSVGASGTFNVPDLRGRFLRGADDPDGPGTSFTSSGRDPDSQASFNNGGDGKRYSISAGGNVGNAVGSAQNDAFRFHNHLGAAFASVDHTHWLPVGSGSGHIWVSSNNGARVLNTVNALKVVTSGTWYTSAGPVSESRSYPADGSAAIPGEGGNETRPANVYCNYIIKF